MDAGEYVLLWRRVVEGQHSELWLGIVDPISLPQKSSILTFPHLQFTDDPDDEAPPLSKPSLGPVVRELLDHCCDEGDVQTCCTVLNVLGDDVLLADGGVDSERATAWFLAYIDLLHHRCAPSPQKGSMFNRRLVGLSSNLTLIWDGK